MNHPISKVLIIGTGADKINQSTEADDAIFQVASSLDTLGIEVSLIDNNPFSVSLDATEIIHQRKIAPVTFKNVLETIAEFKPDAILPNLGGLTSIQISQQLFESGELKKRDITMLSMPEFAINQISNPVLMNSMLKKMNAPITTTKTITSFGDAIHIVQEIGYPVIIKPVSPSGNSSRRLCNDNDELAEAVEIAMSQSRIQQAVLQQSIVGYQEIELVVIRDRLGSMLQVAGIEDFDPIGIHAGDSISFTPTQTLMDIELQELRDLAFSITRKLRIVGVNHVQFALNPETGKYYVIKNSPYFDRITAFAEKATGYPLLYVCANLLMGKTLEQLELPKNFGFKSALLEPTMDHIAVRMPIWPFKSLPDADQNLGTQMRSTGSVMGIGRSTEEALIKAIRATQVHTDTLSIEPQVNLTDDQIIQYIIHPRANRIIILLEALHRGYSGEELSELTKIDPFFFYKLEKILELKDTIAKSPNDISTLTTAKYFGMSDRIIGTLWNQTEDDVRELRIKESIIPTYKQIDFSAGEFEQYSNHFYSTFELENESSASDNPKKALIIGTSGLRLGNAGSADYFTSKLILSLQNQGYETILVNNNPSAVSMNIADKLYIEPLEVSDILQIIEIEHPSDIYVSGSRGRLINSLEQKKLSIIKLPQNGKLLSHLASGKEYGFTMISDGTNVYSLGITSYLIQNESGFSDPTAFIYPAKLNNDYRNDIIDIGTDRIKQQIKPGIYQALFVVTNRVHFEQVRQLPLTELTFLSKVLKLNLVDISLKLTQSSDNLKLKDLKISTIPNQIWAYSAAFPFRSLRLHDETIQSETVIGAEMASSNSIPDALKKLSPNGEESIHNGTFY